MTAATAVQLGIAILGIVGAVLGAHFSVRARVEATREKAVRALEECDTIRGQHAECERRHGHEMTDVRVALQRLETTLAQGVAPKLAELTESVNALESTVRNGRK